MYTYKYPAYLIHDILVKSYCSNRLYVQRHTYLATGEAKG